MARILGPRRLELPWLIGMGAAVVALLIVVIFWVRSCGPSTEPTEPQTEGQQTVEQGQDEQVKIPAVPPRPEPPRPEPPRLEPARPEPARPEPAKPADVYEQYYDAGREAFDRGDYVKARDHLSQAMKGLGEPFRMAAQVKLGSIAKELTFSRQIVPGDRTVEMYHVVRGEQPSTVAKKYDITAELFMKINRIADPRLMMAGKDYKVIKGPFNLVVHKKTFKMDVFLGDYFVKRFDIGLGRDNSTPMGVFVAGAKIPQPPWYGDDPKTGRKRVVPYGDKDNPLGEYWISLKHLPKDGGKQTDYGIHGTNQPATIGTQASRGCIRMRNKDVTELFDLLVPGKSRIILLAD